MREAGLADATGAGNGHQPMRLDQLGHGSDIRIATEQLAPQRRQIGRRPLRRHGACLEHVAAPRHVAHQLARGVAELAADLRDGLRQRVVGDDDVRPDAIDELALADQLPRSLGEHQQHLQRLPAQLDPASVGAQQFATSKVDHEAGKHDAA